MVNIKAKSMHRKFLITGSEATRTGYGNGRSPGPQDTRNGKIRHRPVYIENKQHQIIYTAVDAPRVKNELIDLLNWVKDNQFVLHDLSRALRCERSGFS